MKLPRPEIGMRPRLLFLALAPLLLVVTVIGYYMTAERIRDVQTALEDRGKAIARHLAPACEFGLFSNDTDMLRKLAQDSLQGQDIVYIGILDDRDATITSASRLLRSGVTEEWHERQDGILEFSAPVYTTGIPRTEYDSAIGYGDTATDPAAQQQLLGRVVVRLSKQPTLQRQREILYNSLVLLGLGLVVSTLLALHMVGIITRPVLNLSRMVDRLTHGDLEARVTPGSVAELGKLEAGFNAMADRIAGGKARLENQVRIATMELQNTVNALQQRNTELNEARRAAVEAGDAKAEFLARMSHEIRTPLNAVIGYAGLLQDPQCAGSRDEYVRTINKAAGQLLSVIDSVLNFSRLESGAVQLEDVPFPLREALEDTVIMLSNSAHEKGLELVLLVNSDVPALIRGDAMRISQIVTNLLANAIKFTDSGHVAVRAGITDDAAHGRRLTIAVTDTGIGIDATQARELFRPFAQLDSSVTRRFGGTGLGLIISRMLAKLMDGDIMLDSTPGQGAVFSLVMPCRDATGSPHEALSPVTGKALVYDPHPLSRRAIRNTLLSWGMDVYTSGTHGDTHGILSAQAGAGHGLCLLVLAVQRAEAESPGFRSLLEQALADTALPVLVLTGSDHWDNPYAADTGRRLAWLSKPVRQAALHATITRLLNSGDASAPLPALAAVDTPAVAPGLHVLVVEDNHFNRRLAQELLGRLGVQCTLAEDGARALAHAAAQAYDLILMDIHMPEMDGVETTRRLRNADGPNRETPVIGLTADVFLDMDDQDTGIDGYAYKPVTLGKLATVINRWTGGGDSASRVTGDERHASAVTGMDALPAAMATALVDELQRLLGELRRAASAGETDRLHSLAHQLYGLCGYNELQPMLACARALLEAARASDVAQAAGLVEDCTRTLQALQPSPAAH